mmetsp:Transcript_49329/g.73573  ORF Transcript_49329/g.73573 Transcript_49329/m.73573 type:complete len:141 (-) Transcript_49329:214-636(-)
MGLWSIQRTMMEASSDPAWAPPKPEKIETFDQKFLRKCKNQPLVPVGLCATAYALGSGIKSFYQRDAARSQRMMRWRVTMQFVTFLTFIAYVGFDKVDMTVAPMYKYKLKLKREAEERERKMAALEAQLAEPAEGEQSEP